MTPYLQHIKILFQVWGLRTWIVIGATVGSNSPAYPWRGRLSFTYANVESINISKSGQAPNAAGSTVKVITAEITPAGTRTAVCPEVKMAAAGLTAGAAFIADPGRRALASALNSSLAGHQPCVNLGQTSDKIRIYIWTEKNTPQPPLRPMEILKCGQRYSGGG